jgi:hypothetical protein
MAPEGTDDYQVVYDGSIQPQVTSHLVSGLKMGAQYSFILYAVNMNTKSLPSDPVVLNSCLGPSQPEIPFLISSTQASITIGWNPPSDNGGCPITSYLVERNPGDNSLVFTEANVANDPAV